jgi:ferredoxin
LRLNREYSAKWPNLMSKGTPPEDAKQWDGVPGKLAHFSPEPHDEDAEPASAAAAPKQAAE